MLVVRGSAKGDSDGAGRCGRRVGQGRQEALESAEGGTIIRHASSPARGGGGSECAQRREHRRPLFCSSAFVAAAGVLRFVISGSDVLCKLGFCRFQIFSVCSGSVLSSCFVPCSLGGLRQPITKKHLKSIRNPQF